VKSDTAQAIDSGVNAAVPIANLLFPGSGSAIQMGVAGASAIVALYDALIAAKPDTFTVEEWLAKYRHPIHSPTVVDDLVNAAVKRQDAAEASNTP